MLINQVIAIWNKIQQNTYKDSSRQCQKDELKYLQIMDISLLKLCSFIFDLYMMFVLLLSLLSNRSNILKQKSTGKIPAKKS